MMLHTVMTDEQQAIMPYEQEDNNMTEDPKPKLPYGVFPHQYKSGKWGIIHYMTKNSYKPWRPAKGMRFDTREQAYAFATGRKEQ